MRIATLSTLIIFSILNHTSMASTVEFYGQLGSGIEISQTRINNEKAITTRISDLQSHIGLKGKHPISENTHLIWQFDEDIPIGDSHSLRHYFKRKKESGFGY